MAKNKHIGSSFDDFLAEDGHLEEVAAVAAKRVIAWQLKQAMDVSGVNKTALAERMNTSRSSVRRLLDGEDTSLTLDTLSRGAQALGYRVKIDLVAA